VKRAPLQVEELLTPAEAAQLVGRSSKTVARWANEGRLATRRTIGGHRRFLATEIRALLATGGVWGRG
jgi:excisionase family DNA binding protein